MTPEDYEKKRGPTKPNPILKAGLESKPCATCKKPHSESPRRSFSTGGLLGVCIACEFLQGERAQRELVERMAAEGKRLYEVTYYIKLLCIRNVWAKGKAQAKEEVYSQEQNRHKNGIAQFTVHEVIEK